MYLKPLTRMILLVVPLLYLFFVAPWTTEAAHGAAYTALQELTGKKVAITLVRAEETTSAAGSEQAGRKPFTGSSGPTPRAIHSIRDIDGLTVAVSPGTEYPDLLGKAGVTPRYVYYNTLADCLLALRQGKIDAYVDDDIILRATVGAAADLRILSDEGTLPVAFIVHKKNEAFAQKADAVLAAMKATGKLEHLKKKWFTPGETDKVLSPVSSLPALPRDAPVLRLAVNGESMPYSYVSHGQVVGYEVEVALWLAHALGMRLETTLMDFDAFVLAVMAGRVDMAAGCITITPERAEAVRFLEPVTETSMAVLVRAESSVRFSEPTAQTGLGLMVRTENAAAAPPTAISTASSPPVAPSVWQDFKRSLERNLIVENRWRMILSGLRETIVISLGSLVLGTVMGAGLCALRRSPHTVPRAAAMVYIRALQGTPMVVLLMIFYYILLTAVPLSGTAVAILAFSCNFAAYVAEMFRTSLDALDKGQQEAAVALGFSRWQKFRHVVLPQAARITLPVFKGEFVSLVKMTSVVGYIAVQDLTKVSDLIRSQTYEPFFPLILTAVIYFCVAYACIIPLDRLEAKIDPSRRKRCIAGI